jgi:hypothetical protein
MVVVMAMTLLACGLLPLTGFSQEAERNLAQELTNPIASLYTLPMQLNFDHNLGLTGDGFQTQLNLQPLLPFSLNEDWHLISRTIIPLITQEDVAWKGQDQSGLGDILQSFFLSPSQIPESGWIWGQSAHGIPRYLWGRLLGTRADGCRFENEGSVDSGTSGQPPVVA